ncbi:MAG: hypothetical protein ABIT71_17555 [Vicinamibacteraceae bacterium]
MKTFRFGIVAVVAFALLGAWVLHSQSTVGESGLTDALRDHVRAESFGPIAKVADLPAGVRAALSELFVGGTTLEMADPGMPFQATDVMVMPRLPARRLVSAGCSADHCLVYYERGGFAHVHQIVLLSKTDTSARLVHGGVAAGGLTDLGQIKDALLAGKVMGGSKYW